MRLIERTLKAVNKIRVEKLHLRPLKRLKKGVRSDPWQCPVASSITDKHTSASVGDDEIGISYSWHGQKWGGNDDIEIPTPAAIRDFIEKFDSGKFSEYEAK